MYFSHHVRILHTNLFTRTPTSLSFRESFIAVAAPVTRRLKQERDQEEKV